MNNLQKESRDELRRLKSLGFKNKGVTRYLEDGTPYDVVEIYDIKGNYCYGFWNRLQIEAYENAMWHIANYEREVHHSHLYVENIYHESDPYGWNEREKNERKEKLAKRKQEILNKKKSA